MSFMWRPSFPVVHTGHMSTDHMTPADHVAQPGPALRHGAVWARLGFTLGIAASVAANVAHSFVPPDGWDMTQEWTPRHGAVVGAVFWPLALFVAIEVIARVNWPAGRHWWFARWVGLTAMAACAAVISYQHMYGLLIWFGEGQLSATIGPLVADGLMALCSAALLAIAHNARTTSATAVQVAQPWPAVEPAPAVAPIKDAAGDEPAQVPPRVLKMLARLTKDHPAPKAPATVQSLVDHYKWRKEDAAHALRLFRAERAAQTVPPASAGQMTAARTNGSVPDLDRAAINA